jgi:hypothetical protein
LHSFVALAFPRLIAAHTSKPTEAAKQARSEKTQHFPLTVVYATIRPLC